MGHRPRTKGGYFPVNPVDSGQDLRSEMLAVMKEMGLDVEKHHHEVAAAQHELGLKFDTLTSIADNLQLYKVCRAQCRPRLRQIGHFHAEAGIWR